jgi:isoquinoline 1-oxidoreductase alpha subunit
MPTTLNVNGQNRTVDADPETPLLWVIREDLGLTGTKYGCGVAQCGACTVHVDGESLRSCAAPVGAMAGRRIIAGWQ